MTRNEPGRQRAPASTPPWTTLRAAALGALLVAACTTPPPVRAAPVGINLEGTSDWEPVQMWADVMRQGRPWGHVEKPHDQGAAKDAAGWPTEDAGIVLAVNPGSATVILQAGVYKLSFTGQAKAIGISNSSRTVTVTNQAYQAASNTTTADVTVTRGADLWLTFTGTRRTPGSPLGSGIADVRLLRPGHGPADLFNKDFLNRARGFSHVRFMQFQGMGAQGINSNQDQAWSDRARPAHATYQREDGAPLEHAVALCNTLDAGCWIDLPLLASDDYVTKVAQLLRHGSDGTEPYTSPQAHPVFPPLKPGLKVYVEFVNELWNGGYRSTHLNQALAQDELAPVEWRPQTAYQPPGWDSPSGGVVRRGGRRYLCTQAGTSGATGPAGAGPDVLDGTVRWRALELLPDRPDPFGYGKGSRFELGQRRQARRTAEISALFRAVWGDAAMGPTVRVVLAAQHGNMGTFTLLVDHLRDAHGPGNRHGLPGRPIAEHVYALASAPYIEVDDEKSDAYTVDRIIAEMSRRARSGDGGEFDRMARYARKSGLRWVSYEGGAGNTDGHSDAAKLAAQLDPRMRDEVVVPLLESFFRAGGETFTYYTICKGWGARGGGYFGLSTDISTEATPKWEAVRRIAARP